MDPRTATTSLPDEDLWRLIRRFDKQVSHVQAIPKDNAPQLDLRRAPEEQFPAAKLQKTIERFYVSVVVKCGLLLNHVNQLRSWREPRRTGVFGAVYLIAWLCDLLIPTITSALVAMVFVPRARKVLFPPLPKAEDVPKKETKPRPIHHVPEPNTEEADQEASAFVSGLTTTIAEGADEPVQAETAEPDGTVEVPGDGTDELGKPKTSPAISVTMKVLSDITDMSERVSNLLAPSPPFTLLAPRAQIMLILLSVILVSMILTSNMIIKTISLTVGLIFFGDPVMSRAMTLLNEKIPNWKEYLDIEKTLLKGVPTNAQLTLTLLRIGELNASPLPVPPPPGVYKNEYPSQWQLWRRKTKSIKDAESEADAAAEVASLVSSDKDSASISAQTDPSSTVSGKSKAKAKGKKWFRILRFAKRAITTAMKGQMAYNRAMFLTGAGSKFYAKGLISAVLERNMNLLLPPPSLSEGPHTFEAKFERKRGTAVIDSSSAVSSLSSEDAEESTGSAGPILYFTSRPSAKLDMDDLRVDAQKGDNVMFRISIANIMELRKTEGLGWKGKLIVQLAGGEEAGNEGLVIRGAVGEDEEEKTFHLTDMRGRNQLFNRLVAGGVQCWEMY